MSYTQPEAELLLVKAGATPGEAGNMVASAALLNAALEITMPALGERWEHKEWIVTRRADPPSSGGESP